MEILVQIFNWGSPLGLASFFFLTSVGSGVFFWGLSHFAKSAEKNK